MTRLLFAATLLLSAAFAAAQAPSLEPPAELKKFEWMIGNWSGNVSMSIEGMDLEGPMTYAVTWSGQFLKMESVWDVMGLKLADVGYVGWDVSKGKYSSHTFTNMAPTPRIEWGELKGDTSVWTSEPWVSSPGAPPTESRATITKLSDTEMRLVLEFKMGDSFAKIGEAVFKKK